MLRASEKRKFPRLNAYHLVKYRPESWPAEKGFVLASIKDISAGGMQIVIDEPVPVFSLLTVYINFPRLPQPLPCKAKVKWIKKAGKLNKFVAGLEFVEIDDLCRKNIAESAELINKIIKEKG
jgi:c-di-GMP-binding flagellar brake protein YcgR